MCLTIAVAQDSTETQNKWRVEKRAGLVWVDPGHDQEGVDGYRFTETFNSATFERVDYIKSPGEPTAKEFYKHGRGVVVALGHTRQIVLINDEYTTKLTRVVVAHLADGKQVDVSSEAMEQYQRDVKPDSRLIVDPEGYALSQDDRLVLIRISPIYLSVPTKKEAGEVAKLFNPQWYVVDTSTGQVQRSYPGENPPTHWD